MDKVWEEIIKNLGVFAIFAAAIAWLVREVVEHFMAQDIETYKTKLNERSEKEIELFKAQLRAIARERDIRYSKLHEKRVEAISELYTLLQDAHESAAIFSLEVSIDVTMDIARRKLAELDSPSISTQLSEAPRPPTSKKEEAIEAYRKILRFGRFFRKHQLYFSKELSDQVKNLVSILEGVPTSYIVADPESEEFVEEIEKALKIWDEQEEVVNRTLEMIEDEFRRMLGSEEKRVLSSHEAA
jgi:hypothetical protein